MNYNDAVLKSRYRTIAGVVVSAAASLSTTISVLRLIYFGIDDRTRIASVSYFKQSVYDIYNHTRFLDWFWKNCPRPNLNRYSDLDNVYFLLIYYAVFVGLALYSSGNEIDKELSKINHLKQASIDLADGRIITQIHQLFFAPIIVTFIGTVLLRYLGFI